MEFSYKAKNGPVDIVKGQITAPTKIDAMRLIEQKGYIPIEIAPLEQSAAGSHVIETPVSETAKSSSNKTPKVSVYDICVFTRQLAGFVKASMPLLSALELIKKETRKKNLKSILEHITHQVRDGKHFSEALEQYGGRSFDTRYISMIKAGESGGSLDTVLETLADNLEKEEEIMGQVKSALAYPLLVMLVGMGTVFFLFTFCIPRLSSLFSKTFTTLPLPTRMLMAFSRPGWQAFLWVVFLSAVGVGCYFFFGGEEQRKKLDRFLTRLPLLGTVKLKSDIARFAGALSMLVENGIPVYRAIEVTRPVLSNELLKEDLKGAQDRVLGGERITAVLKDSKYFPPFVVQMVAVGEESGRLSESLREVSRFYSRESLRGIKMLTSLLEPMFILGLSLVVGFVVAGIMLPIFEMNWVK